MIAKLHKKFQNAKLSQRNSQNTDNKRITETAKAHKGLQSDYVQVFQHSFVEEPVLHAAGDMLGTAGAEVEHVDGADAPGVVVTVLPVEEAILPDPTVVVPLAHGIAVGISELVDFVMSTAATCLIIRKIGHQGVADDTPHRHTAGYHHGVATDARPVAVTIGQRKSSLYGKIDSPTRPAAVGVGAGQEGAGSPLRGVLHIAVTVRIAGDGVASVKGGAVIEGACRNEDVDDSPYRTLHKQQEDMPYGIFQETPGQHVYPRPHTIAALLVVGRGQHLEQQVVDARNTMDEDIVYDGVG